MAVLQKGQDETYHFRCTCGIIVHYVDNITLCMCGIQWLRFAHTMVYLISCHNCEEKLGIEHLKNAKDQGWERIRREDTNPPGPWKDICPDCLNLERKVPHEVE